jgi:purine-binding chemotaxis protein CheW
MQATANDQERKTSSERSLSDTAAATADQLQLVTFELGEEEFAIDILAVREINRMLQITRVPQSGVEVEGVINLRGHIIPVVDLRTRFGMVKLDSSSESRIIVVDVNDRTIGFVVDKVHEVLRIDSSIVDDAPTMSSNVDHDYIRGVGKLEDRLLILIDLERLFTNRQLDRLEAAVQEAE